MNQDISTQDHIKEHIADIIRFIGDDPYREGLQETPSRIVRSYSELFNGYKQDPSNVLTFFEDDSSDELILLKDCEFISFCEHHILPFIGRAHLAYIPDGRVVGVSKLVRLLEIYTRRLQIQERICQQVTATLDKYLKPLGSACVLEASHMCMVARGVMKQNSKMVTSSLTGEFLKPEVRQEFLSLIK